MNNGIRLVDRDYLILKEIDRWRIITSRHIRYMTGFSGQRACDRRLHKLLIGGFIEKEKIMYGLPSVYTVTAKGKDLIGVKNRKEKIRVEQISHDISVADTAIYFNRKYNIPYSDITTEKQLHQQDGFGLRVHRPDFIFTKNNKVFCVEVELSLKSKERFKKNIVDNFNNYDCQIWVVPDLNTKIYSFLKEMNTSYPNIRILKITEVKDYEI